MKPDNPRVGYKMGLALLLANKNEDAIEQFDAVLKLDSNFASAYEGIGWAYFNKQDFGQAEPNLRKALERNHRLWRSYNLLGNIYDYRKQYEHAALEYASAIAVAPDKAFLYNNMGVSFTLAGRYQEATDAFTKAIERRYREPKVFNNLGLALANLGRYDEALDAMRQGGSEAQAYNNLGCIYMEKERYPEAVRCFEKAIALEPSFYSKANENLKKARILASKQ
jgi:Flp pilus assembly protein TadD